MRPRGSPFFEGYQAYYEETPGGKRRKRLRYCGEYYGFSGGAPEQKRVKLVSAALAAGSIGLNLWDQFCPAYGGMVHWMAIPSLLSLVPMIFLVMGLVNLLMTREKWEIRMVYAGYRRMRRAGLCYAILMAVWLVMELVFCIQHPALLDAELRYVLVLAAGTGAALALLLFLRRHPAVVVQGPGQIKQS